MSCKGVKSLRFVLQDIIMTLKRKNQLFIMLRAFSESKGQMRSESKRLWLHHLTSGTFMFVLFLLRENTPTTSRKTEKH